MCPSEEGDAGIPEYGFSISNIGSFVNRNFFVLIIFDCCFG